MTSKSPIAEQIPAQPDADRDTRVRGVLPTTRKRDMRASYLETAKLFPKTIKRLGD